MMGQKDKYPKYTHDDAVTWTALYPLPVAFEVTSGFPLSIQSCRTSIFFFFFHTDIGRKLALEMFWHLQTQ